MVRIIHYRKKCIGCGICYELHPGQWRMSRKDGKANLLHAIQKKETHQLELKSCPLHLLRSIEEACPVNAIRVVP